MRVCKVCTNKCPSVKNSVCSAHEIPSCIWIFCGSCACANPCFATRDRERDEKKSTQHILHLTRNGRQTSDRERVRAREKYYNRPQNIHLRKTNNLVHTHFRRVWTLRYGSMFPKIYTYDTFFIFLNGS